MGGRTSGETENENKDQKATLYKRQDGETGLWPGAAWETGLARAITRRGPVGDALGP